MHFGCLGAFLDFLSIKQFKDYTILNPKSEINVIFPVNFSKEQGKTVSHLSIHITYFFPYRALEMDTLKCHVA